ncbi:pyridoxal phosphate-dependent transferase [Bombardia bombarda]|uniref:Pyridoxal phosphate-dependent transferase n=1 Tax=Bombardia bombarda TaxID=252184 RepID=A0AA40C9J3_9PEZI|nr:pyridoxal phosphate-dependent transferase [Bombardia bombarda]
MPSPLPPTGSLLWRSLRVFQVYGANTDVGKTVFASILCKAAKRHWHNEEVAFLKPVSTGPPDEADDQHLSKYAPEVLRETLFQYDVAVSPHIAARVSNKSVPPDNTLLARIRTFTSELASRTSGWLFVETAGGVHSPGPLGSTQADLYMPLRLPVILIGDAKLGGISQTISAFESLKIRGYDVGTVLLFKEDVYQNHIYLTDYFGERHGIPVYTATLPPARVAHRQSDEKNMSQYYREASSNDAAIKILQYLDTRHGQRIERLESMSSSAHKRIWYPFTQHKQLSPDKITVIDSARGDHFQTLVTSPSAQNGIASSTTETAGSSLSLLKPSFDGSASWWTQGLGHGNPALTLAAAYAAGRYGHVMFAEAVHEPALALAETLLAGTQNPRLTRVFYSDNGSTGTEVALKMALRAARVRYGWTTKDGNVKLGVLGLKGSYHGDTIGAMDSAEPGTFNEKVEWYEGRGFWFDYPTVLCSEGKWKVKLPDVLLRYCGEGEGKKERSFTSLSGVFELESREAGGQGQVYERYIVDTLKHLQAQGQKFGALMLEPVVLGAGGMLLVDPLFQKTLVNVVRRSTHLFAKPDTISQHGPPSSESDTTKWAGLPVIFDEVFTGMYRLGRFTAASMLGVDPDISVHAKLLTGGLVPLCTTLASDSIFQAFETDDKSDALLHGHSYTAHAVGCQVALESVRELQRMEARGNWNWAQKAQLGHDVLNVGHEDDSHRGQVLSPPLGRCGDGTPDKSTVGVWSVWSPGFVDWMSRQTAKVDGVWALGSVLAIHMKTLDGSAGDTRAMRLGRYRRLC